MKVLLAAPQPFYTERGTPIAVRLLAETLCAAGHEVDLLTLHEGEDVEVAGLSIHRIAPPPLVRNVAIGFSWKKVICDVYLAMKMARMIRRGDYRVIHAVEESVFPAALLAGERKLVYDMDSVLAEQLVEKRGLLRFLAPVLRAAEGWAVRKADVLLPVCARIARKAGEYLPDGKVVVLEDVPLTAGNLPVRADDLRARFGIHGSFGLYVGNLETYQGIDLLLEGAARAGEGCPDLVIVGGDETAVGRYRRRAEELGVGRRVHFAGPRPLAQLETLLGQADFLVSPRVRGVNTPMKIYSYMASGRPILATDVVSHTQILDETCALIVPAEPAEIAASLKRLAEDRELGFRLGAAAARLAEEKYSVEAYRRKVGEVYAFLEGG